jgi:hypothetical protein
MFFRFHDGDEPADHPIIRGDPHNLLSLLKISGLEILQSSLDNVETTGFLGNAPDNDFHFITPVIVNQETSDNSSVPSVNFLFFNFAHLILRFVYLCRVTRLSINLGLSQKLF